MIEDVLKEIRTAVETFLPAAFNAEDAEYAAADVAEFEAAIVLADVATIRLEGFGEQEPQTLPALILLAREMTEIPLVSPVAHLVHTIDCVLIVADTNPERLARRLYRSVEALRRVLSERVEGTGAASDPVFMVDVSTASYADPFELTPGGLARPGGLTVRCWEQEDRP